MALIGNSTELVGTVGWKGERGYSAYETALLNGFIGTEQDWLATLGTASHFKEEKEIYITTIENERTLSLPSFYTQNSFIDIYVEGLRLNTDEYSINTSTKRITLVNALPVVGTKVEIVCLTMSTNSLPIVETITKEATNDTTPGTKAVHDYVESKISDLETKMEESTIDDNTTSVSKTYSSVKIVDMISAVNVEMETKFDKSNISVLTGTIQSIAAGETKIADINYPAGFNKTNTIIVSKMTSNNNVYYDATDFTPTTNGYPTIKTIALTDDVIRVWMTNTNSSTAKIGYYKITLLKIGG